MWQQKDREVRNFSYFNRYIIKSQLQHCFCPEFVVQLILHAIFVILIIVYSDDYFACDKSALFLDKFVAKLRFGQVSLKSYSILKLNNFDINLAFFLYWNSQNRGNVSSALKCCAGRQAITLFL